MNKWFKIILPNGDIKYVRRINFGHGLVDSFKDGMLEVSNIYYNKRDYEFINYIYYNNEFPILSKWQYMLIYVVKNNNNVEDNINIKLPINTTWLISNGLLKSDLSDMIIIDDNYNIIPWYYNNTITHGDIDISLKINLPYNETKTLYVLFGNNKCKGVFKKHDNNSTVKLPINLYPDSKYKIYTLCNPNVTLDWCVYNSNSYVDVSNINTDDIFVVEQNDAEGTYPSLFDINNITNVKQYQYIKQTLPITNNVVVSIIKPHVNKYYWYFDITNNDTNILNDPIYFEIDSTELLSKGLMTFDSMNNLKIGVIDNDTGEINQFLDYYIEPTTFGTDKTMIWIKPNIQPQSTIRIVLLFNDEYSSNIDNIFDFFDNFQHNYTCRLRIVTNQIDDNEYEIIIQNPCDKYLDYPIKLPIKSNTMVDSYNIETE